MKKLERRTTSRGRPLTCGTSVQYRVKSSVRFGSSRCSRSVWRSVRDVCMAGHVMNPSSPHHPHSGGEKSDWMWCNTCIGKEEYYGGVCIGYHLPFWWLEGDECFSTEFFRRFFSSMWPVLCQWVVILFGRSLIFSLKPLYRVLVGAVSPSVSATVMLWGVGEPLFSSKFFFWCGLRPLMSKSLDNEETRRWKSLRSMERHLVDILTVVDCLKYSGGCHDSVFMSRISLTCLIPHVASRRARAPLSPSN